MFTKRRLADETLFLWDVAASKGYVVNEAMQSYAPTASPAKVVALTESNAGITEKLDGVNCRKMKVFVTTADGTTNDFVVWKAKELHNFPVRIQSRDAQFTLDFSKIKLETPSSEAFLPPEGFSQIASPEVMMSLFLERHTAMRKKAEEMPDLDGAPQGSGRGGVAH